MLASGGVDDDDLPVTTDIAASHGGVSVSVGPLRHIKQSHVRPHGLARLADLYEHVAVHLGDLTAGDPGPQVEAVTVLGDNMRDLGLFVQHEQGHVGSGGLGQAQVTGRDLLTLQDRQGKGEIIT